MVRWVIRSILHGGPSELFVVPASVPRLVLKRPWLCYPVCGMMHTKESLLLIGKLPMWRQRISSHAEWVLYDMSDAI